MMDWYAPAGRAVPELVPSTMSSALPETWSVDSQKRTDVLATSWPPWLLTSAVNGVDAPALAMPAVCRPSRLGSALAAKVMRVPVGQSDWLHLNDEDEQDRACITVPDV